MVEEILTPTQGGVYLAKLDPARHIEVGKIRPVVILTAPLILEVLPVILFICPLSSRSYPEFSGLHVALPPRDGLQKESFALVEHCRSISIKRLTPQRIAQLTPNELTLILRRLQRIVGL